MGILRASKKTEVGEEKELKENPIKRIKRKEHLKPWGKKERYLIFAILFITISASGILAFSSRSWKLPGLSRLKIPTFSLSFLGEETIVIEGDKEKLAQQESSESVITKFKEETDKLSGVYGLYVVNLDIGFFSDRRVASFAYGVNEKEVFEPASLNKLPVMVAFYMEEEKKTIDLETKYELKNLDKVPGAGSLSSRPVGYEITYRNLIRLMGKQSDNTAFKIARNFLGDEKIEQAILRIGMKNTSIEKNETTPEDIGIFFEELWYGNIIENKNRDELLNFLTDTDYEEWLTRGIPAEIKIAHKYGRETLVVNDAGIVYAKEPYVVVIMSKGVVGSEADSVFPKLSNIVYQGN